KLLNNRYENVFINIIFIFSSRRRHTISKRDWSSDVCSSDLPGQVPAGKVSDAIQSLVDLSPTFLDFCEIPVPDHMTGVSQKAVWLGKKESARDHAICEFHHEPTTIHQKTYVDSRYKITVYYKQSYGELFDLQTDPDERNNLWDNPDYEKLKSEMLLKYIWAELEKEPMPMPRISHA